MNGRLVPQESVSWIVRTHGLDIFRGGEGTRSLSYPEAALWDLMTRDGRRTALVGKLVHITRGSHEETEAWVTRTLDQWRTANLIREA